MQGAPPEAQPRGSSYAQLLGFKGTQDLGRLFWVTDVAYSSPQKHQTLKWEETGRYEQTPSPFFSSPGLEAFSVDWT